MIASMDQREIDLSILSDNELLLLVSFSAHSDGSIDLLPFKPFIDNSLYIEQPKSPFSVYSYPYVTCSSDQGSNPA